MGTKINNRFLYFISIWTMLWIIVPLYVVTRFTGALGWQGLLAALVTLYFVYPKVNAWLVVHTSFGRIWNWAKK